MNQLESKELIDVVIKLLLVDNKHVLTEYWNKISYNIDSYSENDIDIIRLFFTEKLNKGLNGITLEESIEIDRNRYNN